MKINIINFGAGNIKSIFNSIKKIIKNVKIIKNIKNIKNKKIFIIPGQGNFNVLYKNINNILNIINLKKIIRKNYKLLGICLGFQLFFGKNYESNIKGLTLIRNKVKEFNFNYLRKPLIGWLLNYDIKKNNYIFYHNHNYYVELNIKYNYFGFYGKHFVSYIKLNNISICQFHPEKSSKFGISFLKKFIYENNTIN